MKLIVLMTAIAFSQVALGQDWDGDQSALWETVSQSWVDDVGETGKWPDAYVHDDVVSWGAEWPVPRGKASMSKWTRFRDANSDVLEYELFPLAIIVKGDTGVAHYTVVSIRKNSEGKNTRTVGGVIETLHRTGGSWKYISLGGFSIDDGN
jgi:hypothetical protein